MGRIKLTFGDKKVTYDSAIRTSSEMFENYQNTMANHQQTVLKNLISDFNLRKKEERDVNLEYMKQRLYDSFNPSLQHFVDTNNNLQRKILSKQISKL